MYDFLPSRTFVIINMIQLPTVAKSSTSLVGDTHSAGYSSRDDRATKMSSFSMCVGANDY